METEKKSELIIDSAIRRFMHFGINKTTMNDVAEDIGFTPSSLYYYFPDKNSLVVAVVERVLNDYLLKLQELFAQSTDLLKCMEGIIDLRIDFTRRFFMLRLAEPGAANATDQICKQAMEQAKNKEKKRTARFIEEFIKRKNLRLRMHAADLAELFLDAVSGLSFLSLHEPGGKIGLVEETLMQMEKKQKALAAVLCWGGVACLCT